jgi:D-serine deaminase-like pyridoxal phosphate-dependent protein
MLDRAGEKPVRVASKSIRCRALLERILARDEGFSGLLTFTLSETLWLAEQGHENLLLAYPTVDAGALGELALRSAANPDAAPIVMVDCVEHLDAIESVLGAAAAPVRVCIDVDAGWWALGGRVKVGPKRSPVHTVEQDAEERQHDDEDHPQGLRAATDVMTAEQVGKDGDQQPEPDEPREDDQQRPHDVEKRVVRVRGDLREPEHDPPQVSLPGTQTETSGAGIRTCDFRAVSSANPGARSCFCRTTGARTLVFLAGIAG